MIKQFDPLGTALTAERAASRIYDTDTVKCFGWMVEEGKYHVRRFTKTGSEWLVEFTKVPIDWADKLTSDQFVEVNNG